jgi:predicted acetyltransferase
MTTDLRVLRKDEWDRWFGSVLLGFGGADDADEERSFLQAVTDPERAIAVWDGDDCVGTAAVHAFRLTVPGGSLVPAGGFAMVTVATTHRRRGMLRAMMRHQLDRIREWGEPLAVLTASEPDIYGRFGFGCAVQQSRFTIDSARVRLAKVPGEDDVVLRRAPVSDPAVREVCERLYAQEVPRRPGMLGRMPGWERLPFVDDPGDRAGRTRLQCVVASRDGEPVGFVTYRIEPRRDAGGLVHLSDLHAGDPAAYAALWRLLFDVDLTSTVHADGRPVDDPLQYLVSDIRRSDPRVRDALYVRLVDVGAALAARTYRTPVEVVLDVSDPFCPWNEGRWLLRGDRLGATCVRTDLPAGLAVTAQDLGTVYLGGVSLAALARAGRVSELSAGALDAASLAFGSDIAPWLPHGF